MSASNGTKTGEDAPLKRFYEAASVAPAQNGPVDGLSHPLCVVLLDGRPVRTPGKAALQAPTEVAEAMAAEWDAQGEHILPLTMPVTRLVNTAIDGVSNVVPKVRDEIAAIAGNDLVVYRADGPAGLVAWQEERWDPVVARAEVRTGIKMRITSGIMPVSQEPEFVAALSTEIPDTPLPLTALHQLTTLTGSALIALDIFAGALSLEDGWAAAHVDEDWNIKEWGEDELAAERRAARKRDAEAAAFVLSTSGGA